MHICVCVYILCISVCHADTCMTLCVCESWGRLTDVWLCWLLAEPALIYLGPSIQGLIKLKDEHPSALKVGNNLSPGDLLSRSLYPRGRLPWRTGSPVMPARKEPSRQPLTLWGASRASWLSWVQLARYQASIYKHGAQVDKVLKCFQVYW